MRKEIPFDILKVPSPCYVLDESLLIRNLELLRDVSEKSGCKILLAQKGFSMYRVYPLIGKYLAGTTASSLFEAKLGYEEMGKEVHIYSPAYREDDLDHIIGICDHIVFNSFGQWEKYRGKVLDSGKSISCGLRINPEYSEVETDLYNPCFTNSRLGITVDQFALHDLDGIDGLHFHTLCEQNSDVLKRTLDVIDKNFGSYIAKMKWINFGGGHHITREGYDIETLIECIRFIKDKYGVEVYLEPGEAVALNTGYLIAEVLELTKNNMELAILDTSAACHMPDVLEMPYRPEISGAGKPLEKKHTYRLGSATCLAGDIIGDYSFDQPLKVGDRLIFCDMAHYTMVKNNTFNGINLPSIALYREDGVLETIKTFGYEDFKSRLS